MSGGERPVSRGAKVVSLLFALLPPARMAWIVFTNGENNLSNDYVHRVSLFQSMLEGKCSFGKYLQEAWIGGAHSGLAIFPIYYLNARFFHWSVWFELGLGLALVGATLALLTASVPRHTRWPFSRSPRGRRDTRGRDPAHFRGAAGAYDAGSRAESQCTMSRPR